MLKIETAKFDMHCLLQIERPANFQFWESNPFPYFIIADFVVVFELALLLSNRR